MIKTIFLGKHTGGSNNCLGIDALKHLITNKNYGVIKCVTVEKDLLYDFCTKNNIDVTNNIEECYDLKNIDLAISYGFSRLIKGKLINSCEIGCINFHPAPLPDWRGMGGVFNYAIYEQVTEWGVTSHFVDETFDTGDIIKVNRFDIDTKKETVNSLTKRSHNKLFELFQEVLNLVVESQNQQKPIPRKKQIGGRYISRADFNNLRKINKEDTAEIIDRKINAFFHPPYHGASIEIDNKEYSLINTELLKRINWENLKQ